MWDNQSLTVSNRYVRRNQHLMFLITEPINIEHYVYSPNALLVQSFITGESSIIVKYFCFEGVHR
jgi:hypothetical protein